MLNKKLKCGRRTLTIEEIDELLARDEWDVIHNDEDDQERGMHMTAATRSVVRSEPSSAQAE